jgi:metallophosphoesterase superfamily enzyme
MQLKKGNTLIISDAHYPYQHPDLIDFLTALKKKYGPTNVLSIGDLTDKHGISFHDSDPDLMSPGDELKETIKTLQPLYKLFPSLTIIEGNHDMLPYRKAKHHGMPVSYLKSYGEALQAPKTWTWVPELRAIHSTGLPILFVHGITKMGMKLATSRNCCVVQGHFHTSFEIEYASSYERLYWSMIVGCFIDTKSPAFEYDKKQIFRPIIGCGMIDENGQPRLLPMLLSSKGRWTGKVP